MLDPACAVWRKSTHSGGGNNCVEVASRPGAAGVRDSKNPSVALTVSWDDWAAFVAAVKAR